MESVVVCESIDGFIWRATDSGPDELKFFCDSIHQDNLKQILDDYRTLVSL